MFTRLNTCVVLFAVSTAISLDLAWAQRLPVDASARCCEYLRFVKGDKQIVGLTNGKTAKARIWDASTGKRAADVAIDSWTSAVALSDGQAVVTSDGEDVSVWSLISGKRTRLTLNANDRISSLAVSDDCNWVAAGGEDNAFIFSAGTQAPSIVLTACEFVPVELRPHRPFPQEEMSIVHFDGRSDTLVTIGKNGYMRVWPLKDPKQLLKSQAIKDGWKLVSAKPRCCVEVGDRIASARFAQSVALSSQMGDVQMDLLDLEAGRKLARIRSTNGDFSAVAAGNNGDNIIFGYPSGECAVLDRSKGAEVKWAAHRSMVSCVSFSSSGESIVSSAIDGSVKVWNPKGGTLRRELEN